MKRYTGEKMTTRFLLALGSRTVKQALKIASFGPN